jgi:hypothetical protein
MVRNGIKIGYRNKWGKKFTIDGWEVINKE